MSTNELNQVIEVANEAGMVELGRWLAGQLTGGDVVYLEGDLGVGKTTLARAVISAMGFAGNVKSPSYGLIESYPSVSGQVAHLDLYRLGQAQEIGDLGLEDYLGPDWVMLIEWPERGCGSLPSPSWTIRIEDALQHVALKPGARKVQILHHS